MSYELKDRLSLKVFFNDWEFPFERVNSLGTLHMSSSSMVYVPMIRLTLQDNSEVLTNSDRINDGAKIRIVVQAGVESNSKIFTFRKNSLKRTPHDGGYAYDIDGYFDSVKYWQESTSTPINASSYGALQEIASICNLNFKGDVTSDSQIWLPRNRRYHEWAYSIKSHGYRTESSCMQLALNFDGTLVYKDISVTSTPTARFAFGEYKEGFHLISDAVPSITAGTANHITGYADQIIEQNILSSTLNRVTKDLTIKKRSREGSLLMSSQVKRSITQGNVGFGPINPGNTHAEYTKAFYQNRRLNSLFSIGLDIVTPNSTDVSLLDTVVVNMEQASGYLKEYSGLYIVASKSIEIKGSEYRERLNLKRKTLNAQLADSVG